MASLCVEAFAIPARFCTVNANGNDDTGQFYVFRTEAGRANRPFRTVAGAIRFRNANIPPNLTTQAILTSNISEPGPITIPNMFFITSGVITSGDDTLVVSINLALPRDWNITGNGNSRTINANTTRLDAIRVNLGRWNQVSGCVDAPGNSAINIIGVQTRGNECHSYLRITNNSNMFLSNLYLNGDAAAEVQSGSLTVKDGQVTIIREIPITRTPIQISDRASVDIIRTNVQYETVSNTTLFDVSGRLTSKASEYISSNDFIFHNSKSPNVYHLQDILDINNGVKDIVKDKRNKVRYINVINKANNLQLINKDNAIYSFFLDDGKIISSV